MLHHLSLGVRDIERASAFYDAILAPLGYVRVWGRTCGPVRPVRQWATARPAAETSWR